MNTERTDKARPTYQLQPRNAELLHCRVCGNTELFIQVVKDEANLVSRDGTHIRLLNSQVDHYLCYFCGERVGFI
ncbi:MAG: hypothetical protein QOF72_189 [Blastocatellia bacterium]|jgi:hypothetical protein|nr:hypothetical protein [Blastocatellia bacterium]